MILCPYNMWERGRNARFDTTKSCLEYDGVLGLLEMLEQAGAVVGVLNGHVHADRADVWAL